MSLDLKQSSAPVTSVEELIAFFEDAERPAAGHQIGLEHEKLVYVNATGKPATYEGAHGIEALLNGLAAKGYEPFRETPNGPAIALTRKRLTVSLEPGGQFELSGTPFRTAREAHDENVRHVAEVKEVAGPLGLSLVALGYRPFVRLDDMPWMPKTRYRVMRQSLPERGALALNMMLMTATGQVSLDWSSEADCVEKVTLAARLSPLMVALYANSPLKEGKPSGYMSYRNRVWDEVDPTRTGYLKSFLDGSFSYRAYVEWALEAPLLFLRRSGEYLRPRMTFRELLNKGYDGAPALHSDWVDHLSTLFPEIRLKKVLEVRGADCVDVPLTGSLPALWRGLLYDAGARSEGASLLPKLGHEEHLELHDLARREGLAASWRGRTLGAWAKDLAAIARRGLQRLEPADASLLDPLEAVAESGHSPAERVLRALEQTKEPAKFFPSFVL
ncbi:MAG: glutamate--cysteine ligase [Myxococcaceae bacterium]